MRHTVERAIVPHNPSASSIFQKEKYNLFAPVASKGRGGMAAFDTADFEVTNQTVRLNRNFREGILGEVSLEFVRLDEKIDAAIEDIGTNSGRISVNANAIASNKSEISTLESSVSEHADEISGLKSHVAESENLLSDHDAKLLVHTDKINMLESGIETHGNRIGDNEADIADLIKSTNDRFSAVNKSIADVNDDLQEHERRFTQVDEDIDALDDRVTTNSEKIEELPHSIELTMEPGTYILKAILKDSEGTIVHMSDPIDLPIEASVVDMRANGHKLIFVLRNGVETEVDISTVLRGVVTSLDIDDDTKVLSAKTGGLIKTAIANAIADKVTHTGLSNILKDYVKNTALENYVTEQELDNILAGFQPSGGNGSGNVSEELKVQLDEVFSTDGTYGLKYNIYDTYVECAGIGKTTRANIVMGSKVKGLPVTMVTQNAFDACIIDIESVTIPSSITRIESNAFSNNTKLNSVYIHKGVVVIKSNAFTYCNNLSHVYYSGSEADWNTIVIETGNDSIKNAIKIFNWKE